MDFLAKKEARIITKVERAKVMMKNTSRTKIIFSKSFRPSDWKSEILNYTKKIPTSSINEYIQK